MRSLRELRRKIAAIRRIQQITHAMRLVSTARLQRAQAHLRKVGPYCEELARMLQGAIEDLGAASKYLTTEDSLKGDIVALVVTSDRGLCGGYNLEVLEKFEELARGRAPEEVKVVAYGKKGARYFRRSPFPLVAEFDNDAVTPTYDQILPAAKVLLDLFDRGEAAEVWAVYTKFVSMGKQYPVTERLLPIKVERVRPEPIALYEPDPERLFSHLVPQAFLARVFKCIMEAVVSEQIARMTAMAQAVDNAQELLDQLTLEMHKVRQALITKEIAEIVTSAEVMSRG